MTWRDDRMQLSVIVPVYNESGRLEATVGRIKEYLEGHFRGYELIIVEDGSTDDSHAVARRIAAGDGNVTVLHNDARQGRGASLAAAIKMARGDSVIYMDADLSTDLECTAVLLDSLEQGASVATGSRLMKGSRATRPLSRRIASMGFNMLVRLLFGSRIHDHQCGFKGFNRNDILGLVDLVQDDHWLWDTELLVLCQTLGLKVDEFPVRWVHNGGDCAAPSKVKLLRDSFMMGSGLLRLKYRLELYDIIKIDDAPKPVKDSAV